MGENSSRFQTKPADSRTRFTRQSDVRAVRRRPGRKRSWEPSRRDKYGRERPPRLTAPAVKNGGSLPSNPSPLARLGLSGLAPKARVKPAGRGAVSVDTPPSICRHPPPTSASTKPCPAACPAPCPGTDPTTGRCPSTQHPHRLGLIDPPPVQNRSHVSARFAELRQGR